jgi:O-antigen ligase
MRLLRRGTVLLLITLSLTMNAPVWYILARVSDQAGGGGWHRAYVIDQAVAHFNEWWLFGTTYTAHWAPGGEVIPADPNMMDITNHYVMEGVKGGILKLILFLAIVVSCFKIVGRRLRAEPDDSPAALLFWAMGVSLFAHCLSFISITYFDQLILIWFWLLAIITRIDSIPVVETVEAGLPEGEEESGAAEPEPPFEFQH